MSKLFHYPGILFLTLAFVASLLASISLPYLPALDIARTSFKEGNALSNDSVPIKELRLGIWSACTYNEVDDRTCSSSELAYDVTFQSATPREQVTITPSWTRGLVVLPLGAAVTLVALCLSLSTHRFVTFVASLVSFLAALVLLVAFAIQIAVFARLKKLVSDLDIEGASTNPGVGFWLTFAALILTLLGGCTVCFGHRRDKAKRAARTAAAVPVVQHEKVASSASSEAKPSFFSRFKKSASTEAAQPTPAPATTTAAV